MNHTDDKWIEQYRTWKEGQILAMSNGFYKFQKGQSVIHGGCKATIEDFEGYNSEKREMTYKLKYYDQDIPDSIVAESLIELLILPGHTETIYTNIELDKKEKRSQGFNKFCECGAFYDTVVYHYSWCPMYVRKV